MRENPLLKYYPKEEDPLAKYYPKKPSLFKRAKELIAPKKEEDPLLKYYPSKRKERARKIWEEVTDRDLGEIKAKKPLDIRLAGKPAKVPLEWTPPERKITEPQIVAPKEIIEPLYDLSPKGEKILSKRYDKYAEQEFAKQYPLAFKARRGERLVESMVKWSTASAFAHQIIPSILGKISTSIPAIHTLVRQYPKISHLVSTAIEGGIAGVAAKRPEQSIPKAALQGAVYKTAFRVVTAIAKDFPRLLKARPEILKPIKALPYKPAIKPTIPPTGIIPTPRVPVIKPIIPEVKPEMLPEIKELILKAVKKPPKVETLTNFLNEQLQDQKGYVNVPAITAPLQKTIGNILGEFTRYRGLSSDVVEKFVAVEETAPQIARESLEVAKNLLGGLSKEDMKTLQYAIEENKPLPVGTDEVAKRIIEIQDWSLGERQRMGYLEKGKWPENVIEALKEELPKAKGIEKEQIEKRIEKLEGLKYLHRVTYPKKTITGIIKRRKYAQKVSAKPYHFIGRKFDTIKEAEEAGYKVGTLMESVAETINDTRNEALKYELIQAINKNPNFCSTKPVADWLPVDNRLMPSAKGKYYHPAMAQALKQLAWAEDTPYLMRIYDKINVTGKMIGFYNPLIMTKNDIFQGWRAAGIKFFTNIPKALMMHIRKDPKVLLWERQGLYNNILDYKPAIRELARDMVEQMYKTWPRKVADEIIRDINPLALVDNLMRLNQKSTWTMDKIGRTACRLGLEKAILTKDMTSFEKTDIANDFMANYAKFPHRTRRYANRLFFVPTYRVSMARVLYKMHKSPKRFRAQLARHYMYQAFMKFVLPVLASTYVMSKYGKKVKTWMEGYRLILKEQGKPETVVTFSDPLLEQTKFMRRKPATHLYFNLAAVPHFFIEWIKKGMFDFPKSDMERASAYFKIGMPGVRDYINWKDKDKTTFQKFLQQMGIAYIYTRQPFKHPDKKRSIAYTVLDAMDFIPHWFATKEEKERVNIEQAYRYYDMKVKQYIKAGDMKGYQEIEKEVTKKYGIPIVKSSQQYNMLVQDIAMREVFTKEEYRRLKTSEWVRIILELKERERKQ